MENNKLSITVIKDRNDTLIDQLIEAWYSAVTATHHFLSSDEINAIKVYVPQALKGIGELIVAYDDDRPIAFMGIDGTHIEMLFIHDGYRGQGIGKQMIQYGFDHYDIRTVDVNEDNPQALGFYQHMGFKVVSRSELDGQGNPYPILHLAL